MTTMTEKVTFKYGIRIELILLYQVIEVIMLCGDLWGSGVQKHVSGLRVGSAVNPISGDGGSIMAFP